MMACQPRQYAYQLKYNSNADAKCQQGQSNANPMQSTANPMPIQCQSSRASDATDRSSTLTLPTYPALVIGLTQCHAQFHLRPNTTRMPTPISFIGTTCHLTEQRRADTSGFLQCGPWYDVISFVCGWVSLFFGFFFPFSLVFLFSFLSSTPSQPPTVHQKQESPTVPSTINRIQNKPQTQTTRLHNATTSTHSIVRRCTDVQ